MDKVKGSWKIREKVSDSIIGGALSLTISAIVVKILGLIYKLPISSILGDVGMGYFNSAYTIYAFFYLLCTAGVPKAIMILVSEAKAKGDKLLEGKIPAIAIEVFGIVGISMTALLIIMASVLSSLIGNSEAKYTLIAIAPTIFLVAIGGVIRGVLSANMRFMDVAVAQIIEGVGKLAFGLLFAWGANRRNMPLQYVSAMTILGVTIGTLIGLFYLARCSKNKITYKNMGQSYAMSKKEIVKRIFAISLPIMLGAAVLSLTNMIDLGLIMRNLKSIGYSERQASALYGNYTTLAVPMFNLAISLISPISIAFLPSLTESRARGDDRVVIEKECDAINITSMISAPIAIGMAVFSREILTLLFKNSNVNIGSSLLVLLSPAIFFSSILLLVNSLLEAQGYVKVPVVSMLLGGIAKIFVSYILVTNPRFGISGAPIGTVVSYCIALIVSIVIYSVKTGRNLGILSKSTKYYVPAAIFVLLSKFLYNEILTSFGELISLSVSVAVAAILYFIYLSLFRVILQNSPIKLAKYTNLSKGNY